MPSIRILCLLSAAVLMMNVAFAFPGNKTKALYREGLACKRSGRLDAAQQCFSAVLRQDSSFTPAYLQLAQVYARLENYRESVRCYRLFLQADSTQAGAWYELGMLYLDMREYPLAAGALEQAAARGYPVDADVHLRLGTALLQMKATDKGIDHLQSGLALRPQDTQAIMNLAHAYYNKGNYSNAIAQWDRLLSLQPRNAFALFMLGKAYIAKGELVKGEELCDRAVGY